MHAAIGAADRRRAGLVLAAADGPLERHVAPCVTTLAMAWSSASELPAHVPSGRRGATPSCTIAHRPDPSAAATPPSR